MRTYIKAKSRDTCLKVKFYLSKLNFLNTKESRIKLRINCRGDKISIYDYIAPELIYIVYKYIWHIDINVLFS